MERHPLTIKESTSFKRTARAVPCVVGFLVSLFFIGRETGGLVTIALMFVSAFAFWILYLRLTHRMTTEELLMPLPKVWAKSHEIRSRFTGGLRLHLRQMPD